MSKAVSLGEVLVALRHLRESVQTVEHVLEAAGGDEARILHPEVAPAFGQIAIELAATGAENTARSRLEEIRGATHRIAEAAVTWRTWWEAFARRELQRVKG